MIYYFARKHISLFIWFIFVCLICVQTHSGKAIIGTKSYSQSNMTAKNITLDRRQSKTLLKSTNADQKSLETEFSIAICLQSYDNRKPCFLLFFLYTFVDSINVFVCRLPGVTDNQESIFKALIFMGLSEPRLIFPHLAMVRIFYFANSVALNQLASSEAS